MRAEIELEREWREAELRFLKNRIAEIRATKDQDVARKVLVVMLYAHFEGLTRALFTIYVNALNRLGVAISSAHSALAAAALADLFKALRNPDSKCKIFARALPQDAKLHRYARDREFLERTADFAIRTLTIDPDVIVDTESNLTPAVLRKILFQLGLDPEVVGPWEGTVNQMLKRRNDVAHGTARGGIGGKDYDALEKAVKEVADALVAALTTALTKQAYLAGTSLGNHGLAASATASGPVTSAGPAS
jgi:hypothetical protein